MQSLDILPRTFLYFVPVAVEPDIPKTMPITYSIDREEKIIMETWVGTVDKDVLAEYWKLYLDNPDVMEIRRTIVDLRESEIIFTGSQLQHLVNSIALPALNGRAWKTAIVAKNSLQFGISRQYQVFAEVYSEDTIFNSIDEARDWILSSPDVADSN